MNDLYNCIPRSIRRSCLELNSAESMPCAARSSGSADAVVPSSSVQLLRSRPAETRVLLIADREPHGRAVLQKLKLAKLQAELAGSVSELRLHAGRRGPWTPEVVFFDLELRDATEEEVIPIVQSSFPRASLVALGADLNGERAASLLSLGVPSLNKPVSPPALVRLARQLSSKPRAVSAPRPSGPAGVGDLDSVLEAYAAARSLSKQQRTILSLYLGGKNDKEIAQTCCCSEATVYEHWRRMARKAGGSQKADVVADFHRFLGAD